MATIKIKFRPSSLKEKEGTLYYQVIHNRIVRQIKTEYRIYSNEWENTTSKLSFSTCEERRKKTLSAIHTNILWDLKRFSQIIADYDMRAFPYTSDEIISSFVTHRKGNSFFSFMEGVIIQLKLLGKHRTSETYTSTLASFTRFRLNKDIMLDEIDSDVMMTYEAYLKSEQVCLNTISFYMRILRAVYNRAAEKKLITQCYPFKYVYTGIDKTIKRAVSLETIRRIKNLDLSFNSSLEYVKDMFLFSFYTRGMSFVDMAYLRKKDLNNGVLSYRRKKTRQQLHIKWEKCMQQIVEKYPCNTTPYLLPIINSVEKDERTQYSSASAFTNRKLKEIQQLLELETPLTMYVTRHSWASIAKNKNIPIAVISESLGHDSEATTQIYLASLSTNAIDKANALILKGI